MDSPIWLYCGIVAVALLIGTIGARMLKGLEEALPRWLFYVLIIGFVGAYTRPTNEQTNQRTPSPAIGNVAGAAGSAAVRRGGWNGSMIRQAKGMTMRKYKIATIPAAQKAVTYLEGKQAFTKGQRRSYNPYTAHNLELGAIWWNGWDTGEEESNVVQLAKKKS